MEIQQPTAERVVRSPEVLRQNMVDNMYYSRGANVQSASDYDIYMALARAVRNHLVQRYRRTVDMRYATNPRFVYYLSAEYLLGRQLPQNLLYTDMEEVAPAALEGSQHEPEEIMSLDVEPGLGNGGLGRLAACFLDSLATLDIPAIGYGIRYEYGIFRQDFVDGYQVEQPDDWLKFDYPWEFAQPDDMIPVSFGGHTEHSRDEDGRHRVHWRPTETVMGEPHHILVPGYNTNTVNFLRLWRARATTEFDFGLFDTGDYASAVEAKVRSETISKVLYPNDNTPQGRELRLRQQYFFTACSLHDIIARFLRCGNPIDDLAEKVVIQLNDTHPVVGIPELMRLLLDEYGLEWHQAWEITRHVFAYTCHTLMPEALEKWPVSLFERLLPRHMEIISEINRRFLVDVSARFPNDYDRLMRMSIIEENGERQVRMAHLAVVGSFSTNGVAALHSQLLKERVLRDFNDMWPERFNNKTNGVTPRRFMRLANPRLSSLLTERLGGDGWLTDLDRLSKLEEYVDDPAFRAEWQAIKAANKADLAAHIEARTGILIDPNSIYDVMVKRLHEYKRQLLKALHIITLYNRVKDDPTLHLVPTSFIFGAKAAPGYYMAKLIIKLINSVGAVVNADPEVNKLLRVAFLPNFNVTQGEIIYPAADLSEQISMAGKEASGTGNMKFALNGALTVGTLDGANIEILERVGAENFFLFGLTVEEVFALKANGYKPRDIMEADAELKRAITQIGSGHFGGDPTLFQPIVRSLLDRDEYLVLADYRAYVDCQDDAQEAYRDREEWTRKSILNAARCGFFSSDRAMRQYAEDIWKVEPLPVP